jgi:hypothetical protein
LQLAKAVVELRPQLDRAEIPVPTAAEGEQTQAAVEPVDAVDVEWPAEPIPVDRTAELLGRARPKKPRVRSAAGGTLRTPRTAAASGARKPATRRIPRPRKAPAVGSSGEGDNS